MPQSIQAIWSMAQQRWAQLSSSQRLIVGGGSAALLLTTLIMMALARHVGYSVLYTDLQVDQAGPIVEKLEEQGVPYQVTNGGRTIKVPEKLKGKLRLEMQMNGSLDGVAGYKILDEGNGLGLTESDRKIRYQRALEGELTKTLRQLTEIVSARIHLVIPDRALFGDPSRTPTASVVLQLYPGAVLAPRQVAGIRALVASSVEGLAPEKVQLVNSRGNLISSSSSGDEMVGNGRYEVQTAVSSTLEKKAQTLLDQILGPGKSAVRIVADLDFESIDREIESFDPDGAVVRSEEVSEGTGSGTGSNTSQVTNFEINRTMEHVRRAPGNILRLTISVSVDGRQEPITLDLASAEPQAEGEEEDKDKDEAVEMHFVPLSDQELAQLGSFVKNSVGYNEARGDQFHIGCVEFGADPAVQESQVLQRVERQMLIEKLVVWGLWFLAIVLVFISLRKVARTIIRVITSVPAIAPAMALAGEGVDSDLPPIDVEVVPGGVVAAGAAPASPQDRGADAIMDAVSNLTRSRPEESAAMLRTILTESE